MTQTVSLRPIERDDVAAIHSWDSRERWPDVSPKPWTGRTLTALLAEFDNGKWSGSDTAVAFAVEADGRLVGTTSLWSIDAHNRNGHLGVALDPAARGQGYGSAACRALLEYAFVDRGLHRVQLECLATNEAAIRTYKAVGFVEEGRLRESAWVRGVFVDEVIMSLLPADR